MLISSAKARIFEDKALNANTGLKLPEDEHQWVLILGYNS